jgi:hypothetical protein
LGDASRDKRPAQFCFALRKTGDVQDQERRFTLTPHDIGLLNPNTRTSPIFRSRADAELTKRIYARVPVLADEAKGKDGNLWGIDLRTMLHMSNDSRLFHTARQLEAAGARRYGGSWIDTSGQTWLPLYEAKMTYQFDHRWGTYDDVGKTIRDVTSNEKRDVAFEPVPRYWVPSDEVDARLRSMGWQNQWLVGWHDIANAASERTVIATALPRVGAGNKIPLIISRRDVAHLSILLANFCSITLDYVARQKVGGTTLNFFYIKQFPMIPPYAYGGNGPAFIVPRVLELVYTSTAMQPFARDLDYDGPPFAWDPGRRAHLRAELDAYYARLYGLTRDELRYILDPTDVCGPGYPSETFRVLKEREIKEFGEYRTARLVLDAWDRSDRDTSREAMAT